MASVYRIDAYNLSGTKVASETNYLEFTVTRRVNYPGVMQVSFQNDHSLFGKIERGYYLELWRKDPGRGIPWYKEFGGIYRGSTASWPTGDDSPGVPIRTITVVGYLSLLDDRIVAYPAGTLGFTTFNNVAAESISKLLVNHNAGPRATTGWGRITSNVYPNLSVDPDQGRGNLLYLSCAFDNVLQVLQEVAQVGGGDFDIIRTTGANLEFQWFPGQLGTDRTNSVTFAMAYGNMKDPVWTEDATQEKTVAIVAGSGQGDARTFVTRTGTNYVAGTNARELYVDARDVQDSTNLLNARGDQQLKDAEMVSDFDFEVVQTPYSAYGLHYFLGDLGTAENPFTGDVVTVKIDEVTISMAPDGEEEITVKVREV